MQTEKWKSIKGYEGLYEVSNNGCVKSIARVVNRCFKYKKNSKYYVPEKIKTPRIGKNGYVTIALVKENITTNTYLHRIIAIAFIENPLNYKVINHKDGNKLNNSIENLEWCSSSYNNTHALDNKLRSTRKSMTEDFVNTALSLKSNGFTNIEIANKVNSTKGVIQGITSGKTYKRLYK